MNDERTASHRLAGGVGTSLQGSASDGGSRSIKDMFRTPNASGKIFVDTAIVPASYPGGTRAIVTNVMQLLAACLGGCVNALGLGFCLDRCT